MVSTRTLLRAQLLLFHLSPLVLANPLRLVLPTLFNSALSNSTNLSSINTSSFNDVSCFDASTVRPRPIYYDCTRAIAEMDKGTGTRPYIFGRGDDVNYKLPRTFISGTCLVNLDMVYDDDRDTLPFLAIKDVARDLATRCIDGSVFKVGGVASVSPRKLLYITIMGTVTTGTS